MDFSIDKNDLPILTSSTTRDQAADLLSNSSEIFQSLVPRSSDAMDILRGTVSELAGARKRSTPDPRWGDSQHDKLFKLPGVKRLKSLSSQPFCFMICFSLMVQLCSPSVNLLLQFFLSLFIKSGIDLHYMDVSDYRSVCKKQTVAIKHSNHQLKIGDDWLWLVEWDQFCGYNAAVPMSPEEVEVKVRDWCSGPVERPRKDAPAEWQDYNAIFKQKAFELFSPLETLDGVCPEVVDWVLLTDQWVTSGSSRGERVNIFDNVTNRTIASKNSKAVFSQKYDAAQLARLMIDPSFKETYNVAEKVEPGQKGRLIISAGLIQQMRLCYVDSVISPKLKFLNRFSTLFMSSHSIKDFYDKIINSCDDATNIHLPLDVSNFDHSVSTTEVYCVFDAISDHLMRSRLANKSTILLLLTIARNLWFGCDTVFAKKTICKWQRGVPSGVRWTSFMDTVVGVLRFEVCMEHLGRDAIFGKPLVSMRTFQGDDMQIVLKRISDVVRIITWFNSMNIEVSPTKNFISIRYDEFLRKVYRKGGMTGYATRRLVKLAFRDPLKTGPANRLDMARAHATSVWSLIWRGANKEKVVELIEYGCNHHLQNAQWFGSKPSKLDVLRWLCAPSCLGGVGLDIGSGLNQTRPVAFEIVYTDIAPADRYSVTLSGVNRLRSEKVRKLARCDVPMTSLSKSVALSLAPEPPRVIYKLKKVFPLISKIRINQKHVSIFRRTTSGWKTWRPIDALLHLPYDDIIAYYCDTGDTDSLRNLTAPECHKLFDTILTRCHISILYHWVKADLPKISTLRTHCSDLITSVFCDRVVDQCFSSMLSSKNNISYSDFVNCSVLCTSLVNVQIVDARRARILYYYGS